MLGNSRTEPRVPLPPVTPRKLNGLAAAGVGLMTPETGVKYQGRGKGWGLGGSTGMDSTPSRLKVNGDRTGGPGSGIGREKTETQATATTADGSDDEFYDWPATADEELEKVADEASGHSSATLTNALPPPETPRKAARTEGVTSPGKRGYDDFDDAVGGGRVFPTPGTGVNGDDIFGAASTGKKPGMGLFAAKPMGARSPDETPTPIRYKDVPLGADSELASEILTTLAAHAVALPAEAREAVKNVCNRHALYTCGVLKGRDVSRAMVKSKDEKLVEMKVEVEGLKSERETDRAVIRHLRRDMALRKEAAR